MVWLITGAGGQLGSVLLRRLVEAGEPALGIASPGGPLPVNGRVIRMDLTDRALLSEVVLGERPQVIVHAAAVSSVAYAHANPDHARRVNAVATGELAVLGARVDCRFVYVSTDMVFDGESAPYDETASPGPLSEYGRSKLAGERAALEVERSLVARLPLLYGAPAAPRPSTFLEQARLLRDGDPIRLFHDEVRTPLWLEDAASSLILAARSDLVGLLHLGGPQRLSRLDMGKLLADALKIREPQVKSVSRLDMAAPEPRPHDLSLDSSKFTSAFGVPAGRTMQEALAKMTW